MNWRKNEGYCMRKVTGIFFFLLLAIAEFSWGQSARLLRQRRLNRWDIPPANYSGIVPMGNGRYAVVSDKGKADGFYLWHVEQDSCTGKVLSVTAEGFRQAYSATSTQFPQRDSEGIAWNGTDGKLWISAEDDQQILAYFSDGYRIALIQIFPQTKILIESITILLFAKFPNKFRQIICYKTIFVSKMLRAEFRHFPAGKIAVNTV